MFVLCASITLTKSHYQPAWPVENGTVVHCHNVSVNGQWTCACVVNHSAAELLCRMSLGVIPLFLQMGMLFTQSSCCLVSNSVTSLPLISDCFDIPAYIVDCGLPSFLTLLYKHLMLFIRCIPEIFSVIHDFVLNISQESLPTILGQSLLISSLCSPDLFQKIIG